MAENALEQSQPDTYASDASRHSISAPSSPFHNSPCGSRGAPASPGSKSPAPHGLSHQLRQTHDSGNGVEDSVYEVVRDAQRRIVDYLLQVCFLQLSVSLLAFVRVWGWRRPFDKLSGFMSFQRLCSRTLFLTIIDHSGTLFGSRMTRAAFAGNF